MINVIWYQACRGNWDHGVLCEIFEKHTDKFIEINIKRNWICEDKAIVIVAGCPDVTELRRYLDMLRGGVVILTSEEDAYFNWQQAIPTNKFDVWTQYYAPSKAEIKTRLLLGPPNRIKDYKINRHLPKKYLWSFVGQVQNPFRQQCVDALKQKEDGQLGCLREVELFGGHGENAKEYQEYLDIMCQSKYVICPAGSMCVDSFRLYEAMECGAIPITDKRSPRDNDNFNYWKEVYPLNDIRVIDSWQSLPNLFMSFEEAVEPRNEWWSIYKKELEQKLINAAN